MKFYLLSLSHKEVWPAVMSLPQTDTNKHFLSVLVSFLGAHRNSSSQVAQSCTAESHTDTDGGWDTERLAGGGREGESQAAAGFCVRLFHRGDRGPRWYNPIEPPYKNLLPLTAIVQTARRCPGLLSVQENGRCEDVWAVRTLWHEKLRSDAEKLLEKLHKRTFSTYEERSEASFTHPDNKTNQVWVIWGSSNMFESPSSSGSSHCVSACDYGKFWDFLFREIFSVTLEAKLTLEKEQNWRFWVSQSFINKNKLRILQLLESKWAKKPSVQNAEILS